ncbi:MAG: flagellar export chaperone FliS [Solirubrobacteraceae bacterium]
MTYASASHASYRESAILTAPPEQLVVMLYDGAHRFLLQAVAAMREGQTAEAGERLGRAMAIIDELQCTLDLSAGVVAERLSGIYVFCRRHLADGLCERDPSKLEQVQALMRQLRDAWAQAAAAAPAEPVATA